MVGPGSRLGGPPHALLGTFLRARPAAVQPTTPSAKRGPPPAGLASGRWALPKGRPAARGPAGWVGMGLHEGARISAAHGGQILLSEATRALVESSLATRLTVLPGTDR